ncbi:MULTISPECIES: PAS domain-containing protein [Roseomonadaceae]|uniref:histidine kinase n=1 Tax=Falsiroseomonas oleicola TaxID=2801474 RepID=A0ABS6HCS4_9PROT|nr:PAS domain-containing protein [Roseomonas oleicola]MBU8546532.1 PAS domain-containing protein [Roseomonas oleicola]
MVSTGEADWSGTPLGPMAGWSSALRGFSDLVREHAGPAALIWGPDLSCLHNPAFAPLLPPDAPQGQACGLLWPGADGIAAMVRAALAGRPGRLASLERPGPRFFDLLAVPLRDLEGCIAGALLTATDITRPVLAERRDGFLLDLDAALRDLDAPETLLRTATAALGRHLAAGRCAFAEVDATETSCGIAADWTDGTLPSAPGTWPLARFGAGIATLRAGRPLGLDVAEADGGLTVPLLKQGRLAALLGLHHPTPRRWTESEAALALEVAERLWSALRRRRAEAALRASEARLRRVQQVGRVGGFEIDLRTGQNLRSPEYMDLQGRDALPAEEQHADWVARLHPEDRVRAETRFLDAIAPDSVATEYAQEYRIVTPAGAVRWIAARAEIQRDASGRALRMLGAHVDVTELKQAEAALAESVQRAREVLESLGDMLYALDAQGAIRFASRRALELWGLRREEVLGRDFLDLFPTVRGSQSWEAIERVIATGQEAHLCARSPLAGTWFELNIHPAQGGGVTVAARDVEAARQAEIQRRMAEVALRGSVERLRLAQEAGQVGTWEWDIRTGDVHWSESCHRLYGTDPAEPIDLLRWRRGVEAADRPRVETGLRRLLAGDQRDWAEEFRIRRVHDGALRWIAERGEVVRDRVTGQALRLLGVALDVTERRESEERQTVLMRELDHRAKNALAVVQAAVRMTPKDDPEAFANAVLGRIAALARAHTLLADGKWDGVGLQELVAAELAPFLAADGQPLVRVEGPPVRIAPTAAQALSMALHELATNAIRHGALSVPGGQVSLGWFSESGLLHLRWIETGGPPLAAPPRRQGFGTRVLEATIAGQLGGSIAMDWRPEGLLCQMTMPLARASAPDLERELANSAHALPRRAAYRN